LRTWDLGRTGGTCKGGAAFELDSWLLNSGDLNPAFLFSLIRSFRLPVMGQRPDDVGFSVTTSFESIGRES
jgi:hypothetical protein